MQLLKSSNLIGIDVSGNKIGSTGTAGTVALAGAIAGLSNLTEIRISNNSMGLHGTEGTNMMVQSLISFFNLAQDSYFSLYMRQKNGGFSDSQAQTLIDHCPHTAHCYHNTDLYPWNRCDSIHVYFQVIECEAEYCNIETNFLSPPNNTLIQCFVSNLLRYEKHLSRLTVSKLLPESMMVLLNSLGNFTNLNSFNLSNNSIGQLNNTEIATLAGAVSVNRQLTKLDLSNNTITSNQALRLLDGMQYLTNLTDLDLGGNDINHTTLMSIEETRLQTLIASNAFCSGYGYENSFYSLTNFTQDYGKILQ